MPYARNPKGWTKWGGKDATRLRGGLARGLTGIMLVQ